MKKVFLIGLKDLQVILRDRAALILMLAAPLVLTIGLGFVSGSFSDSSEDSGIQQIPVVLVNEDEGQLGQTLAEILQSDDLGTLLAVTASSDVSAARQQVEDDEIAALVLVPAGYSAGILPDMNGQVSGESKTIEIYSSPARPISSGIVKSIVSSFADRVDVSLVSSQVAVEQLVSSGLVAVQEIPAVAQAVAQRQSIQQNDSSLIRLNSSSATEEETEGFNVLAFFATGMAVFFLMYTVTIGGRSILVEKDKGTLPRLLASPTTASQVLGGKIFGVFLTGFAQVGVLVLGTSLMFQLDWGDPLGVLVLVAAVAGAATGWGILLAAFAKSAGQVSSLGTAMMLLFGILGGTFLPTANFAGPLRLASKITPNAWAQDGFIELSSGGVLVDVLPIVAALLAMTAILFVAAVAVFRRRWESLV